ncbi:TolC family protein [Novosphingobium resinovorum]|uniref:TolC family protein n=1 Tax=Novosphingobium resinovorum TaxID=158500 RepID=UPI002ED12218|nr:TolC family protein [Novosphingobium resinovorum]
MARSLASAPEGAEATEPMPNDSLAAAVVQAYVSNSSLAAARYDLRATDDELGLALVRARTTVDLQVSGQYDLTLPGRTTQASRPLVDRLNDPNIERNSLASSLIADQPLYAGGRISSAVASARAGIETGREALRGDEGDMLVNLIAAYSDVRRGSRVVAIRETNVQVLERMLDEVAARREAGELTRTDIAQAETQLQAAQVQLDGSRAELESSRATFAAIVGREPGTLAQPPALPGLPATIDDAFASAEEANPNVLIELGYAKKALGVDRVVTVWNTAFTHSRFEDLPFDLRGRRGSITYALEAGASREELGKARAALVDGFVDRIGTCLDSIPLPIVAGPASQSDPSLWIEPGAQFRVNEDFGSGNKAWAQGGRWYLRVLPHTFDPSTLDGGAHGPFVGGYGGYSWGNVTGGVLTYNGSVRADAEAELDAASMWFRSTGEIWTAQTRIGADWKGRPCFFGDHIPEKWADLLDGSLKRLHESNGIGPFRVRLGVTGLEGLFWPDVQTFVGEPPTALEPAFETEFEVADATLDDWRAALVEAWTALRRIFGLPPPKADVVEETVRNATR